MVLKETLLNNAFNFSRVGINHINKAALNNSWAPYNLYEAGANFAQPGYFVDALGFVKWQGLVASGTVGQSIFTLGTNLRPSINNMFPTNYGAGNLIGRVDACASVAPTPNTIYHYGTGNSWYSLENIYYPTFIEGFETLTLSNGYAGYDALQEWDKPRVYKDIFGWVHLTGLLKQASAGKNGTVVFTLPAKYRPDRTLYLPVLYFNGAAYQIGNANIYTDGTFVFWHNNLAIDFATISGLTFMAYDSPYIKEWKDLTSFSNNWVSYSDAEKPQYIYTPDGYISFRGSLKSGTAVDGTIMATVPSTHYAAGGARHIISVACLIGIGAIDIQNGTLMFRTGSNTKQSLDSVRIRAANGIAFN